MDREARDDSVTYGAAVIGIGWAGVQHLEAYSKCPRTELVAAVCTARSERRAGELQRQYDLDLVTTDYLEVLERDDVHVVSICTPNHLHAKQMVDALAAGKHLLVEKPMVTSGLDTVLVVEAARRSRSKILVGHVARFSPFYRAVKQAVLEERIGVPFYAESNCYQDLSAILNDPSHADHLWWLDPNNRRLAMLSGGADPIDLLRWIVGDIEELHAFSNNLVLPELNSDDCVVISLKFRGGCIGKVLVALGAKRPYALDIGINGTVGTVINNRLYLGSKGSMSDFDRLPVDRDPWHPKFGSELEHLLDCIDRDEPTLVDAVEGARTVLTCLAAADSLKSGKNVTVDFPF